MKGSVVLEEGSTVFDHLYSISHVLISNMFILYRLRSLKVRFGPAFGCTLDDVEISKKLYIIIYIILLYKEGFGLYYQRSPVCHSRIPCRDDPEDLYLSTYV